MSAGAHTRIHTHILDSSFIFRKGVACVFHIKSDPLTSQFHLEVSQEQPLDNKSISVAECDNPMTSLISWDYKKQNV